MLFSHKNIISNILNQILDVSKIPNNIYLHLILYMIMYGSKAKKLKFCIFYYIERVRIIPLNLILIETLVVSNVCMGRGK